MTHLNHPDITDEYSTIMTTNVTEQRATTMDNEPEQENNYQDRANEWIQLARENPDAFEAMRLKLINESIKSAPAEMQRRLKGLQWKIDHVRSRASNPTVAFIEISNMMWDSTLQLRDKQQDLLDLCHGIKRNSLAQSSSGKILNFKRVNKR